MRISVLFENSAIVVINKPAGIVVTPDSHHPVEETVVGWLLQRYGDAIAGPLRRSFSEASVGAEAHRPGIVHRLDKDTSGVMVVAKTQTAWESLVRQFKRREVEKEYLALVWGDIANLELRNSNLEFIVDAPIGRHPGGKPKFAVVEGGKRAVTRFEVVGAHRRVRPPLYQLVQGPRTDGRTDGSGRGNRAPTFTLLKAFPKTGRTHQIRVHLKALGHPIVGDSIYQTRRQGQMLEVKGLGLGVDRMFLHATRLGFKVPPEGQFRTFDADLPESLQSFLKSLQ